MTRLDIGQSRTGARPNFLFATVPQELLLPPAVRHREQDSDKLSPFEFSIMAAVIGLARNVLNEQRHREALKAGAEAIEQEKELEKRYREEWREVNQARQSGRSATTPRRLHAFDIAALRIRPTRFDKALSRAGTYGYATSRKKQKIIPDVIPATTSRRALLLTGGLAAKDRHFHRLSTALDRLTKPVKGIRAPLLREWHARSGRLHLDVTGAWLNPPFHKVPLPLPLRPQTLALFLFLQAVNTSPINERGMRFDVLCRTLGINSEHRQRDLNRAIAAVNLHLAKIPTQVIEQLNFPIEFYPIVEGRYVRFSRRLHRERSNDVDEGGYVRPARRGRRPLDTTQAVSQPKDLSQRERLSTDLPERRRFLLW